MPRKTQDPELVRLLDQQNAARRDFERWYTRLKRAFTRMEKARQKIVRLQRRIDQHSTRRDSA